MRNPLSLFYRWLHYQLLEKRDDIYAPNPKHRPIIHNIYVMQAWAASTIILGLPLAVFSVIYLLPIPYFVVSLLVVWVALIVAWVAGALYVKLDERDYTKTKSSAADLLSTTH